MTEAMTFLDALVEAAQRAGKYNPDEYSRPVAVLWPDGAREWEPLLPLLRDRLPLVTLGAYDPGVRTGPSYWVRCMLARTLEDKLPEGQVPVVYLPGVTKQDIRAIEECRVDLQPIASMQYEGTLFAQLNGKDWTVRAFIESDDGGGLGIDIGGDNETKRAVQRALLKLAAVPVEKMRSEAPLRASFFDALLNPDEARNLLTWLNDPEQYPKHCTAEEWGAFRSVCRSKYGFDPEKDGPLKAGQKLGERMEPAWELAWARFTESPTNYPNLPDLLRRAKMGAGLFARPDSWPQDNESAESGLRRRLLETGNMMPADARAQVKELDGPQAHGQRRQWVWAKLGLSPLAMALEPLARAAAATESALTGSNTGDMAQAYAGWGWEVDGAVLEALALVEQPEDVKAVEATVRAVYRPWLEEAAKQFQSLVGDGSKALYEAEPLSPQPDGTCLLFVDALRMDIARRLSERLGRRGLEVEVSWRLAALPTITATAKPAVTPVGPSLRGGAELSPATITGTTVDATVLRKLLKDAGYQVLGVNDLLGDPNGLAWTEAGELDETGHVKGVGLERQIDHELREVEHRIAGLIGEGWKRVVVVTDHGFLLMPGGLPKVQLPEHLAVVRKGRCARLKAASYTEQQTVPWHWDEDVRFAMAPGITCFEAGKEYEHGGLSPQECVTPVVTVSKAAAPAGVEVAVGSLAWMGLRCKVTVQGTPEGSSVDLRKEPANGQSSVASGGKPLDAEGKASLLVEDDDLFGGAVYLVVLGPSGSLVLQSETRVGEAN